MNEVLKNFEKSAFWVCPANAKPKLSKNVPILPWSQVQIIMVSRLFVLQFRLEILVWKVLVRNVVVG